MHVACFHCVCVLFSGLIHELWEGRRCCGIPITFTSRSRKHPRRGEIGAWRGGLFTLKRSKSYTAEENKESALRRVNEMKWNEMKRVYCDLLISPHVTNQQLITTSPINTLGSHQILQLEAFFLKGGLFLLASWELKFLSSYWVLNFFKQWFCDASPRGASTRLLVFPCENVSSFDYFKLSFSFSSV